MPTILLVEKELVLLRILRYALEHSGYTVLSANSGESAIRVCEKHQGLIDVLVSDVVMHSVSGLEVAAFVKSVHPKVIVILMSGSPRCTFAKSAITNDFLEKPFEHQELLTAISRQAAIPANAGGK